MTEIPQTPSELAMSLWLMAIDHLDKAVAEQDTELSDAYVNIGQLSLMASQFVINNQAFIAGVETQNDPAPPLPSGAPPIPAWGQRA